jgi:hypothetical protein
LICIDYRADEFSRKEWIDPDPDDKLEKYGISYYEKLRLQSVTDARCAGLDYTEHGDYEWEPGNSPCRWRPGIFMPRSLSRITLEITAIRCERLHDITAVDARREGIQIPAPTIIPAEFDHDCVCAFAKIWRSINGENSWDENPWVWVIEFRRIENGN